MYQARDIILKLASGVTDIAVVVMLFGNILIEFACSKGNLFTRHNYNQ